MALSSLPHLGTEATNNEIESGAPRGASAGGRARHQLVDAAEACQEFGPTRPPALKRVTCGKRQKQEATDIEDSAGINTFSVSSSYEKKFYVHLKEQRFGRMLICSCIHADMPTVQKTSSLTTLVLQQQIHVKNTYVP